jgi:hydrogenase nickel incorporation protein HypA/HybF
MHELSVASAVVDTAVRHAGGRRVTAVHLRVGALRQVVPDSLAFYFEHVARGTLCDGARLEQDLVPATVRCEECGVGWELDEAVFRCGACGSGKVRVEAGDELEVESIDVEEEACTASA